MSSKPAGGSTVEELLTRLEHPLRAEIDALRELILGADERVREAVKWNAPSFYITDHFATLKLYPVTSVQVVFHTGTRARPEAGAVEVPDPTGLLKWPAKDRCVATFSGMGEITARRGAFTDIVRRWIERTSRNQSR